MKKIILFILFGWIMYIGKSHAQNFTLAVNKLDEFTKEIIRIAPYQLIAVQGVFEHKFININIRRNGYKYYIGFQSQYYLDSNNPENNAIKKGSKIFFKLLNDTIVNAQYNSNDKFPIVTYNTNQGLWRYYFDIDFEIDPNEVDKLLNSPIILFRLENNEQKLDVEVKEKYKNSSPRNYFMNFIPLLK